jgi:hypothetical protein
MPTIMDVNEIHMPYYEPTTMQVEEEQNPTQEVEQPEEDMQKELSLTCLGEKGHNRKNMPWV